MPVTTPWMESVVKQMSLRVKGTEMFWNDPQGAEAILQVRAGWLSDDDRLLRHLRNRPGCPLTRRPKHPSLSAPRNKSSHGIEARRATGAPSVWPPAKADRPPA